MQLIQLSSLYKLAILVILSDVYGAAVKSELIRYRPGVKYP